MDLRSIVHAQNVPDGRKGSSPKAQTEGYGPSPASELDQRATISPTDQKALKYSEQQRPQSSYPPPIRTSSSGDQYPGNEPLNGVKRQNVHPVMRRKGSSQPSRSQIFCEKLSQTPIAKVDPSGPPPQYEGGSSTSSQGYHSLGQSTPAAYTPTGSSPASANAYSSFQRPTSSQSVQTPTSAQYPPASFPLQSPNSSDAHSRPLVNGQYYQYSSQPQTPLGPPTGRPSHHIKRDSPVAHHRERTFSSGSNGYQRPAISSPAVSNLPPGYDVGITQLNNHSPGEYRSREKSVSVSPKTKIENLPASALPNSPHSQPSPDVNKTLKRKASESPYHSPTSGEIQARPIMKRSASMTIDGLLNEAPAYNRRTQSREFAQTPARTNKDSPFSPTTPGAMSAISEDSHVPDYPRNSAHQGSNGISLSLPSSQQTSVSSAEVKSGSVITKHDSTTNHRSHQPEIKGLKDEDKTHTALNKARDSRISPQLLSGDEPARKRPRLEEETHTQDTMDVDFKSAESTPSFETAKRKPRRQATPIFAQSVRRTAKSGHEGSLMSNKAPTPMPQSTSVNGNATQSSLGSMSGQTGSKNEVISNGQQNAIHVPVAQPGNPTEGPLGRWEPSILNIIPSEEVAKVVSDFLFAEVVLRDGIGVGPAGGTASQGAVLEVEAKIGRLIDRNTNDRLRLPVMSECVIQHRALNKFLNGALVASQPPKPNRAGSTPPPNSRTPISYKHSHETDSFFELTQKGIQALPPAIAANFNSHHKNKTTVRFTHDQKSGKEIAKIVKARVADIDVYSPRTLFDFRISVNIEMNFEGGMEDLVEPERQRSRKADRNKDRMSYKHQAYQIDLTQVTPTAGDNRTMEKDHELEIEVSSEEIRRQGLLARDGQPNQYQDLIRGFVDNVRILARHCQPSMG